MQLSPRHPPGTPSPARVRLLHHAFIEPGSPVILDRVFLSMLATGIPSFTLSCRELTVTAAVTVTSYRQCHVPSIYPSGLLHIPPPSWLPSSGSESGLLLARPKPRSTETVPAMARRYPGCPRRKRKRLLAASHPHPHGMQHANFDERHIQLALVLPVQHRQYIQHAHLVLRACGLPDGGCVWSRNLVLWSILFRRLSATSSICRN